MNNKYFGFPFNIYDFKILNIIIAISFILKIYIKNDHEITNMNLSRKLIF